MDRVEGGYYGWYEVGWNRCLGGTGIHSTSPQQISSSSLHFVTLYRHHCGVLLVCGVIDVLRRTRYSHRRLGLPGRGWGRASSVASLWACTGRTPRVPCTTWRHTEDLLLGRSGSAAPRSLPVWLPWARSPGHPAVPSPGILKH